MSPFSRKKVYGGEIPPWRVTLGRQRIFTAPLRNASSVAWLDHTYASPIERLASFSEVRAASAALAFWMCLSHAGELNLWSMIRLDSSIKDTGTEGGS